MLRDTIRRQRLALPAGTGHQALFILTDDKFRGVNKLQVVLVSRIEALADLRQR